MHLVSVVRRSKLKQTQHTTEQFSNVTKHSDCFAANTFAAVSTEELKQTSKNSSRAIIYKEVNIELPLYYHQFPP